MMGFDCRGERVFRPGTVQIFAPCSYYAVGGGSYCDYNQNGKVCATLRALYTYICRVALLEKREQRSNPVPESPGKIILSMTTIDMQAPVYHWPSAGICTSQP